MNFTKMDIGCQVPKRGQKRVGMRSFLNGTLLYYAEVELLKPGIRNPQKDNISVNCSVTILSNYYSDMNSHNG